MKFFQELKLINADLSMVSTLVPPPEVSCRKCDLCVHDGLSLDAATLRAHLGDSISLECFTSVVHDTEDLLPYENAKIFSTIRALTRLMSHQITPSAVLSTLDLVLSGRQSLREAAFYAEDSVFEEAAARFAKETEVFLLRHRPLLTRFEGDLFGMLAEHLAVESLRRDTGFISLFENAGFQDKAPSLASEVALLFSSQRLGGDHFQSSLESVSSVFKEVGADLADQICKFVLARREHYLSLTGGRFLVPVTADSFEYGLRRRLRLYRADSFSDTSFMLVSELEFLWLALNGVRGVDVGEGFSRTVAETALTLWEPEGLGPYSSFPAAYAAASLV